MAMRAITTTTRRARALGGVALVVALLAVSACSDSNDASTAPTDTTVDRGEVFVGVTPVRVLDTRQEGSAKFTEGETRTLSFADQVPDTATSVALAIVAPSGATALGYFTMWPSGRPDRTRRCSTRRRRTTSPPPCCCGSAQAAASTCTTRSARPIWSSTSSATSCRSRRRRAPPGRRASRGRPAIPARGFLSGATDPAFAVGAVGDFYLNTATATLFARRRPVGGSRRLLVRAGRGVGRRGAGVAGRRSGDRRRPCGHDRCVPGREHHGVWRRPASARRRPADAPDRWHLPRHVRATARPVRSPCRRGSCTTGRRWRVPSPEGRRLRRACRDRR